MCGAGERARRGCEQLGRSGAGRCKPLSLLECSQGGPGRVVSITANPVFLSRVPPGVLCWVGMWGGPQEVFWGMLG